MTPDLRTSFESRSVRPSYGVLLLEPADALDLIEAARQKTKPILGLDAFVVTATIVQPFLEHSIDLSVGPELPADSWSEARQFVEQRCTLGFVFEVVV